MKKTLQLVYLVDNLNIIQNCYQPPIFLNYWDIYEEDLNLEYNLNIISIVFLIFLLVGLKSSCIPKISLLACLYMEIAMKKNLKLGF